VGNAGEFALDHMLDEAGLPLERPLVDAAARPEEKTDGKRKRHQQCQDRWCKNRC
jgi:hypothetical protein